jgi:Family of unknown function (DUF6131)
LKATGNGNGVAKHATGFWLTPARVAIVSPTHASTGGSTLILTGIVCLILGALFNIAILWAIGVILIVLGLIFWILGAMGRAVGGRRHYY